MKSWIRGAMLLGLVASSCEPEVRGAPLPPAGSWSRFEVVDAPGARPPLTELRLSVPPATGAGEESRAWFQLEAFSATERLWALAMEVSSLDFLVGPATVSVHRYVLFAGADTLEFIDRNTGEALLPRLGFFENLLPRAGDDERPFFREGTYLGRTLRRVESGTGAALLPVDEARRLDLDPDVLVGTSRHFRDDGTGQKRRRRRDRADYRYVDLTERDYRRMMDAGMNVFRVPVHHLAHVIDEPVFFLVLGGFRDRTEILYRSNFLGAVMYMDEPAARLMNQRDLADAATPGEAAAAVTRATRERYEGSDKYGRWHLDRLLRDAGCDFGFEVLQGDYPVWEAVASAAWYEFEAGIPAWCYEGRFQPSRFAELTRDVLGVDFPADPEANLAFHFAFFTGAARRFDGKWGVSVYGQMDDEAADLTFPRAYDAGATYFWLWTSDRSHHVPFERQLELVREFRRHRDRRPRRAPARELTRAAQVAIALPWGYLGPEAWLPVPGGARDGRLWGSDDLALGARTDGGATYREVLRQAVREAARLCEAGVRFDFVFLRPDERATGYERVHRVLETAEVIEQ